MKTFLHSSTTKIQKKGRLTRYGILLGLLTFSLITPSFLKAQTPFTQGNLVTERVGDGTTTLGSAALPIVFQEFSTGGGTVQTISPPASTTDSTHRLMTESGSGISEGHLTLSAGARYITCVGYEAATGTTTVASADATATHNRVIGLLSASGTLTNPTTFNNTTTGAFWKSNYRSAYYDETGFWAAGDDGNNTTANKSGIHYSTTVSGSTSIGGTSITSLKNCGQVFVYKGQLYATSTSGANSGVLSIGTGKPTSGSNTATLLPLASGTWSTTVYDAVLLDVSQAIAGPDLLYVTTTSSGALTKYYFDGTNWNIAGTVAMNSGTGSTVGGGIVAARNTTDGSIDLYIVKGQTASGNGIVKYNDATGRTGSITGLTSATLILSPPSSKYSFFGLSWAPSQTSAITTYSYAPTNGTTISAGNYGDITIAAGVTATLGGNITINGTLSIQSGGTLICGTNVVSSPEGSYATFDLQSGGTLKIGDLNGITNFAASGNIRTFSRFYSTGGNYEYTGSAAQATGNGLPSIVNNLTISNTGGIITLTNPVIVAGTVDASAAAILAGTLTVTGTINVTAAGNSNDLTHQYSGTLTLTSATVNFDGTSAQQIGAESLHNLTLNNSFGLTLTGTVTVGGTVMITAGTISLNSNTLTTTGASATFNGSGAQSTGSWFPSTITSLTINNSSGVTLSNPLTVTGTLNLNSGILGIGNNKLIVSGSIGGTPNSSNYIYIATSATGVLEMAASSGGIQFPIGDDFNPITILDPGNNTFDVSVANGITENDGVTQVPDDAVNRTWTIKSITGSTTISVTPQWDNTADLCAGGHFDLTHAYVSSRDITIAPPFTWIAGSTSDISGQANPYTVHSSVTPNISITNGDNYNIGVGSNGATALPVNLVNFNATYRNNAINLSWLTASEQNNSHFDIERSLNATNWNQIGTIEGHGTTQTENKYLYIDPLTGIIPTGNLYYRLKQVDFNNQYTYSNISVVQLEGNQNGIYPNPASSVLNLNLASDANEHATVMLVDMNGKLIQSTLQSLNQGNNSMKIDLSNVPFGNYMVKVITHSSVQCYRLMKTE